MKNLVDAIYLHIPFCNYICGYCDFCKVFYNENIVDKYLESLKQEVLENYKGEVIDSLYIGGGTPSSLNENQLIKLFSIIKLFNLKESCEITFEANSDSLQDEKIKLLKDFGVNRVSLGVESISAKLQNILERRTNKDEVLNVIDKLKKAGISNINVDLIYAIEGETLEDLKEDLNFLLSLDVPHISTYSLIIEDNTKLKIKGVKNISKELDRKMYDIICKILKDNGYIHYEVSNFAKDGYYSRHNLKYWNNLNYYGFGVGSSGYIDNIRYANTRSITNYIKGNILKEREEVSLKDKIFYEVMLCFRTNIGIDKENFRDKYNVDIDKLFDYKNLVKDRVLDDLDKYLRVNENYFYILDEVIVRFLESLQTNVYNDIMN